MATQELLSPEMEQFEKPKTLICKLAEACAAIGFVEKRGKNEKQNYNYVKATDVAAAIRHEFFSRKIIVVCDEKEYTHTRSIKTNSGGEMGEFKLRCEYTFYDGETGESLGPLGAFGVAMDTGDKAIYKAKTGALKYVLRGIGLIPDENADPETDEKVDEFTSRPHTSTPVQGVEVDFGQPPADYDDSQLLDAPPAKPGACKKCGGKIIPAGVSKKSGKPYKAFCGACKEPA